MATENAPAFEDLTPINTSNANDDDEEPTLKLDAGEHVVAEVRYIEQNAGEFDNTLLHLTDTTGEVCKMWSNRTIDSAFQEKGVGAGDVIGIKKDEEPYTFEVENDDGEMEEREAYGFDVRLLEDS